MSIIDITGIGKIRDDLNPCPFCKNHPGDMCNFDPDKVSCLETECPIFDIPMPVEKWLESGIPVIGRSQEQEAFEKFAESEGCDMSQHPLHYIFLNSKTNALRAGWRSAIVFSRKYYSDYVKGVE